MDLMRLEKMLIKRGVWGVCFYAAIAIAILTH